MRGNLAANLARLNFFAANGRKSVAIGLPSSRPLGPPTGQLVEVLYFAGSHAPASIKRFGRLTANAYQHRGVESDGVDKTAFPRWSVGTSAATPCTPSPTTTDLPWGSG